MLKIEEVRLPDADAEGGYRTQRREEVIFFGRIDGVFSTQFELRGGFSPAEARELALVLRSGALAAPFYKVCSGTVSASLGQDNVRRGQLALITGLAAVLAFMAARYRAFGLITNAALLANLVLMIGVLALLGAALTLPGMAGEPRRRHVDFTAVAGTRTLIELWYGKRKIERLSVGGTASLPAGRSTGADDAARRDR